MIRRILWLSIGLFISYLVITLTLAGAYGFALAVVLLTLTFSALWVRYPQQGFLLPSYLACLLVVIGPILYSLIISFTNLSNQHALSFSEAKSLLLDEKVLGVGIDYEVQKSSNNLYRLTLSNIGQSPWVDQEAKTVTLDNAVNYPIDAEKSAGEAIETLTLKQTVPLLPWLQTLTLEDKSGAQYRLKNLREFAIGFPKYRWTPEGTLQDLTNAKEYTPDFAQGFFISNTGQILNPGFTTFVGLDNYRYLLFEAQMANQLFGLFVWTTLFASLVTFFSFFIGIGLASLLAWHPVAGSNLYRWLIIAPYGVPAFISILTFKMLFNQQFGPLNQLLSTLFSIQIPWQHNVVAAKTSVILVGIWLTYPLVFLVASGVRKTIPNELYQAAALDGAFGLQRFWRVTLPLTLRPMLPLIVATLAFNFNNLVLVQLLTEGLPLVVKSEPLMGHTDLLINFAYRLAFTGESRNLALASAVSTLLFLMVAGFMAFSYKAMKRATS